MAMTVEERQEYDRIRTKKRYDLLKNDTKFKEAKRVSAFESYHRRKGNPKFKESQLEKRRKTYSTEGSRENWERLKKNPEAYARYLQCQRDYHSNTRRVKSEKVRIALQEFLGAKCVKCGITDHRLLDFDHIYPKTKVFNIAVMLLRLPWEQLIEEVKKCQLLCANCHRLKTREKSDNARRLS